MVRELAITVYLFIFKILFNLFKLSPLKNKTVFVVTFGDNSWYVYKQLKKMKYNGEIVFLKSKRSKLKIENSNNVKVYNFETYQIFDTFFSIYHLATARKIFVDNYYGFLSAIQFKKEAECIQLWHAAGAIKQFGIHDPSNQLRTKRALIRFQKVYKQFHKIIVGSENLAKIYFEAFGVNEQNILRSGIPRTDIFYNINKIEDIKKKMLRKFPSIKNKKVILYAPTYREAELDSFRLQIDYKKMYEELGPDIIIMLRLHPAINNHSGHEAYPDYVIDCSRHFRMNDLLFVCDYLITDYSSIPFEFAILEKPMIFYPYDLESYLKERGFWEEYDEFVPGPVVYNTDQIIESLKKNSFDYERIRQFKEEWNQYSIGKSSETLVKILYQDDEIVLGAKDEYTD
ncbi:CDP-glycerol glycerophosphotransferase family protein [Cytobacillus firmus]|uniref:CDP-glycerol glycerophosphotransferase family protein n=1 Tax=Cytobacillus firmus TaxID=1399 RepID=UPI00218ADC51|nr:CDP-glycerol glycerophosphotransferase family protein [Cytobacillus firmus]URM33423.1 CDP-glycerol glycerophosphotransferase family protein [Cytobacillus firmus]